jgi:hypothetical protein
LYPRDDYKNCMGKDVNILAWGVMISAFMPEPIGYELVVLHEKK